MNNTLCSNFYFPLTTNEANAFEMRKDAMTKFNDLIKTHPYVVLIRSYSEWTKGYWVSTKPQMLGQQKYAMLEQRKVIITARWDHTLSCQVFEKWNDKEQILLNNIWNFQKLYGFRVKSIINKNDKNATDNI